jgi:hypothetical protein
MINFNTELTQADAKWILEEVVPKSGWRVDTTTLTWWMQAHNKAFREQVGIPGCSCEYVQTSKVWQSRINQYQPQIEAIAYPPVQQIIENNDTRTSTKTKRTRKSTS